MPTPLHTRRFGLLLRSLLASLLCAQISAGQQSKSRPDAVQASRCQSSPDGAWLAEVTSKLEAEAYHFQGEGSEQWSAPNPAQALSASVHRGGIDLVPVQAQTGSPGMAWQLRLSTRGFGRSGAVLPLASKAISGSGERVEIEHGALLEWFQNTAQGIEQGWTIAKRPAGSANLVIEVAIAGGLALRLDEQAQAGVFVDEQGVKRAGYSDLKAWDANGKVLKVWMQSCPSGVQVLVDDTGASYPLHVDPLMSNLAWSARSNQAYSYFGVSVSSAGDVNGDGFDDVIVGASRWVDPNGPSSVGRALVYLGSETGLNTVEAWSASSDYGGSGYGVSVAGAGDVNGDGFDDVIVGAPDYAFRGRAYVYHGSANGLSSTPDWIKIPLQAFSKFGTSVAGAGDVNGDGYGDVVIGAPRYTLNVPEEGGALVYLGSAQGLGASEAWIACSGQYRSDYASAVASAGDVNGDGFDDVLVGALRYDVGRIDNGRAFIFHGSANGPSASPDWFSPKLLKNDLMGHSVASAGDVNGDGFDDVIVGAIGVDAPEIDEGRAFVFHGSASGVSFTQAWSTESDEAIASYGYAVSGAGDINGDGYDDVLVGAYRAMNANGTYGRAYLFEGSPAGLGTNDVWGTSLVQQGGAFGAALSAAGDVNGDGLGDVIIGALNFLNVFQVPEGAAFAYHGEGAASLAALASVHNGSGSNPMCFASEPPVIGRSWDSSVDTSVRAQATFSALVIHAQSASGLLLSGGEVLLDLSSSMLLSAQSPAAGTSTSYAFQVPADAALAGLSGTAQAVVFGAGYTLCNAYEITLGF